MTDLLDLMNTVGSGPKSAADLDRDQARAAFRSILDRDPDPTTLGAFLLANRWKRNTPEELAAFVDVMRERSVEVAAPDADPVDCGANYDGKTESALLGVAAGVVSAAAGVPVAVHSADRVPGSYGTTYRHVLGELGVVTDLAPGESAAMLDDVGVGFYDALRFNRGVADLLDRREMMGVRTFINTVETLANPADAGVHLGSFYHLPFAKKVVEAVEASETLTFGRVLMFQGMEGYDDIRPGYTKLAEWGRGGEFEDDEVETASYGMDFESEDLGVDAVAADSAAITEAVLEGDREDRFADAVALNAALRLYAGGRVGDLEDGLDLARKTVADGEAAAVLAALREWEPTRASP